MTERHHVSSGTTWEDEVGYARAVRVGKVVYVSGTTATGPEGKLVGVGDPYLQTKQALVDCLKVTLHIGKASSLYAL